MWSVLKCPPAGVSEPQRKQRYFSLTEDTCFRCGEPGHYAQDCTDVRSRPCFVCSQLGHTGFDCPQNNLCFICRKTGHISRDCPNRDSLDTEGGTRRENICMRCGHAGHEAAKCFRDYDPEDLKLIECFICRQKGHLSCAEISLDAPAAATCFNCGESGHTGEGCARPRGAMRERDQVSSQTCYICGEIGHFARGCSKANEWPKPQMAGRAMNPSNQRGRKRKRSHTPGAGAGAGAGKKRQSHSPSRNNKRGNSRAKQSPKNRHVRYGQ